MGLTDLMEYCGVGRSTAERVGNEARARVKIGRRTLYDREAIDTYIDNLPRDQEQREGLAHGD